MLLSEAYSTVTPSNFPYEMSMGYHKYVSNLECTGPSPRAQRRPDADLKALRAVRPVEGRYAVRLQLPDAGCAVLRALQRLPARVHQKKSAADGQHLRGSP